MSQMNILQHIFVVFHSFKYKIHSLSDDKRKDAINSFIEKQEVGRKQTGRMLEVKLLRDRQVPHTLNLLIWMNVVVALRFGWC